MGETTPAGRIARQLDYLMRTGHPDGTGPTEYLQVAEASQAYAAEHGGPTISHQGVHNLRSGKIANPTVNSLRALANVYQVPCAYFFEDGPASLLQSAPAPQEQPAPDTGAVLHRLDILLAVVGNRGEDHQHPPEEMAEEIRRHGGVVDAAALAALRQGVWTEALRDPLNDFATRIGVPAAYFFDDEVAERSLRDLRMLSLIKGLGVRQVAMRGVAELDEEALQALVPVIEHLSATAARRREG